MTKIRIKQVDAFTTVPHMGNPAGVVLEAKALSDEQMQVIARGMNLPETAFVLPALRADADLRLRWFTPAAEVPICGHATVASFHSLAEEGRLGMARKGKFEFAVESASGVLPVEVAKDEGGCISVMLGLKIPTFERVNHSRAELVRILNVSQSEFDKRMTILRSDYLLVPVRRLHTLFAMKPNFLLMTNYLTQYKLRGMCVFTTETIERESVVHSRFFAPHTGINEDPVTGSAHGPLAVYLFESGLLNVENGRCVFQAEQGDAIGRRGRITVELCVENGKPVSLRIGGRAVTVLEGEMLLAE